MHQLITKRTFALFYFLIFLSVSPWVGFLVFNNKATTNVKFRPEGSGDFLTPPMTYYLLMSKSATGKWIQDYACKAISAGYTNVESKYSKSQKVSYFSISAWEQFVDFQKEDQMIRVIKNGELDRSCAPLITPTIYKTINYDGHIYSFFQTQVLSTLRSRSSQSSIRYTISGAVKSTDRPSTDGNIFQFIQFYQKRGAK